MTAESLDIQTLVSLPAATAGCFPEIDPHRQREIFVTSDPPNSQLGSGGGTAHLLFSACGDPSAGRETPDFRDWLNRSQKLLIHGSGESRRLPAYAAPGKPLIPVPQLKGLAGQRPDQVLLDLQRCTYERLFWLAPSSYRVMVTCGDVLLSNTHWLPSYPNADVLIVGLTASIEEAQRHGVMICPSDDPCTLHSFLQKPDAERLRSLGESFRFYLDTGVWLLSEKAVSVLMNKCGWDEERGGFTGDMPACYDLYSEFGQALGRSPAVSDADVAALTSAVLPLQDARFYHFGTNRSLLASVSRLQHPASDQRSIGHASMESHVAPVIQYAEVECDLTPDNRYIWIENSHISRYWRFTEKNVVTGAPANDWKIALEPGKCLDFVAIDEREVCVRFYGFDDGFRGALAAPDTEWLGERAAAWFEKRGLAFEDCGFDKGQDIHTAPLFPVVSREALTADFVQWLVADVPDDGVSPDAWLTAKRFSAKDLLRLAGTGVRAEQRRKGLKRDWSRLNRESWAMGCSRLDLAVTAEQAVNEGWDTGTPEDLGGLAAVHNCMFRFAVSHRKQEADAAHFESQAFESLRRLMVEQMELSPVHPRRNVLDDQIVWGRSPVRLDLAGGWTDTPPYCLEHGGCVVNVAGNLNGQPPIQVFARICEKPEVVFRSIDLGIDERIETYEELACYAMLGSGFGIARAALCLAGLEPRFHDNGGFSSLREHLESDFGGGIELSMLAAVPKGSGLGTSSILAATLLGTVGELCGLHWDTYDLFARTMALEQMLTSGGGWQDQAGGVVPGIKLIETAAGLSQQAVVRALPARFFEEQIEAGCVLLYYTGITRVAHDILGEIVRGLFLNSAGHLGIIDEIGRNARFTADAVQRGDWHGLCEAVRRSWVLNQRLDPGTNTPEVQAILDRISNWTKAVKLLGAGGGGYLLIFASDAADGRRLRETLESQPPNSRARFVDLSLSRTGFQMTRS